MYTEIGHVHFAVVVLFMTIVLCDHVDSFLIISTFCSHISFKKQISDYKLSWMCTWNDKLPSEQQWTYHFTVQQIQVLYDTSAVLNMCMFIITHKCTITIVLHAQAHNYRHPKYTWYYSVTHCVWPYIIIFRKKDYSLELSLWGLLQKDTLL